MKVQLIIDADTNSDLVTMQTLLGMLDLSGATAPAMPSTSALVVPPPAAPVAAAAPPATTLQAPPPAAPPAAPEEPAAAGAPLVDNFGVAFDPNVHSSSRKIHTQGAEVGRFHKKRGLPDATYNAKYAGLVMQTAGAVPPAAMAPPAAPSLETPVNPLAALAAVPAPPSSPAVPSAQPAGSGSAGVLTPANLFQFFSQITGRKDRPLPPALGNEVLKQFGLDNLVSVAQRALQDPNLVPTLAYTLEQRDLQWLATGA